MQVFLQSFNLRKCVVVMVEGLFSLLFYCESGINQYAGKKTLTDVFRASLLLLQPVALETLYCHTIQECFFMLL